jgi:hypothetical protein
MILISFIIGPQIFNMVMESVVCHFFGVGLAASLAINMVKEVQFIYSQHLGGVVKKNC